MPTLNYDLSEIPDIVELQTGRVTARLTSCTKGKSKNSGNPTLTWTWKVLTGPDKGQDARSWTSLQDNALFGLKQHLLALGFKRRVNDVDTDDLIGKKVILVIGMRPMANDKTRMISGVTAILPLAPDADEDEDEEEEAPKPKKKKVVEDDEEEDEPKPKKKRTDDDEAEDEEERPRKKRPADDEEEQPKKKFKTVAKHDDDEEEEEEKPKKKKRKDDDDELPF